MSRRAIQVNGQFLGGMTVSMLKGEDGLQRKELDKLIDWLKTQPLPDVVILPFALLIGLAKPIREALGAKIVCTLQGEDLFLEQLVEPWKSEAKALIRDQIGEVDLFTPTSDYYRTFTVDYLGIPLAKQRTVPLGLNFKDFDYLTPFVPHREPRELSPQWPEPKRGAFTVAFLGRIAPEKGLDQLAEAYVRLRKEYGLPPSKLEAAGWMGADQKPYLAKVQARLAKAGLSTGVHLSRRARSPREGALPRPGRRLLDAGAVQGAEGLHHPRGDGGGRAGRAAGARRLHRDGAEDRRRRCS